MQRNTQLSIKCYSHTINDLLYRYHLSFGHLSKLRIISLLEKLVGVKRIIAHTTFGVRMAVDKADLIQRNILYEGVWETELTEFLLKELKSDDIFMDIGANIGYFTLLGLSKRVQQVIAFEPDPLNSEILSLNLSLNLGFNAQVITKALGSSVGSLSFKRTHVANTGVSGFMAENAVIVFDVEIDTLDNLLAAKSIENPTVIKIDVEGWEQEVFNGAINMLKNTPPRLIIFEAFTDISGKIINQDLVRLLEHYNFRITESLINLHGPNHVARYIPSL